MTKIIRKVRQADDGEYRQSRHHASTSRGRMELGLEDHTKPQYSRHRLRPLSARKTYKHHPTGLDTGSLPSIDSFSQTCSQQLSRDLPVSEMPHDGNGFQDSRPDSRQFCLEQSLVGERAQSRKRATQSNQCREPVAGNRQSLQARRFHSASPCSCAS